MKTEAGMYGVGHATGAWRCGLVGVALRWCVLSLTALAVLPEVAWGQQARKMLEEIQDRRHWEDVGGCEGAEKYLDKYPKGLHADEARECLKAGEVEALLAECEAHFAAGRLSTGRGGSAVDCYEEVLSMDRGNKDGRAPGAL